MSTHVTTGPRWKHPLPWIMLGGLAFWFAIGWVVCAAITTALA